MLIISSADAAAKRMFSYNDTLFPSFLLMLSSRIVHAGVLFGTDCAWHGSHICVKYEALVEI